VDGPEGLDVLWGDVRRRAKRDGWRYVEMRPLSLVPSSEGGLAVAETYAWHRLDLRQTPERLWQRLHPDCVRRKIRRAAREGLVYDEGRSATSVAVLHDLVQQTRRRHGLPPAPRRWLVHLVAALGDDVTIRIARKAGRPVAGIMTVRSGPRVLYKYGGSDATFHPAGGVQALLWRAIEAARAQGAEALDLGRSDRDQPGLLAFKDRWGSDRMALTYYRYPARPSVARRGLGAARPVFGRMPAGLLDLAGRLLYRHVG
jgi:lipid II:glycine glycyltransferase (peptidoglycan interpeptide bridge formation enzyme)